jgi:two-component system OmpR family response regulator
MMRLALTDCPDALIRRLTTTLSADDAVLGILWPGAPAEGVWDVILASTGSCETGCTDSVEHIRSLRRSYRSLPILVVADDDPRAVVAALDAGADAVVKRPVDGDELRLRLRALAGRAGPPTDPFRYGCVRLDRLRHTVEGPGGSVALTPREYLLLQHLLLRPEQVVSRRALGNAVWWEDDPPPSTNLLDVHVSHLRKKLELAGVGGLLRTIRGLGFVFGAEEPRASTGEGGRRPAATP